VRKRFSSRLKKHWKNFKENLQREKLQNTEKTKEININLRVKKSLLNKLKKARK